MYNGELFHGVEAQNQTLQVAHRLALVVCSNKCNVVRPRKTAAVETIPFGFCRAGWSRRLSEPGVLRGHGNNVATELLD